LGAFVPKHKRPKDSPTSAAKKRAIDRYEHTGKQRINNPPVGLVTPETDPPLPTHKIYEYIPPVPTVKPGKDLDYDPHLDPQLVWAGKKEHSSFEVHTVSLHVHETIDPRTIIEAVRKRNGNGLPVQPSLFERPEENLPLRDAIDFYKHAHGWSNRLIAGDSLLIMNSLLEKEGMAGQVQMVYIDPPYGIRYGSNFQPFVNKRDVKDGKDEDLTQEPEMIRAFRDTWELGIHSYLTYLRDRLLLAKELLHESGSVFVQIGDQNVHLVRDLIDEIFGRENFAAQINFRSMTALGQEGMASVYDYILWYGKDGQHSKFRPIYRERLMLDEPEFCYLAKEGEDYERLDSGRMRSLATEESRHIFKRSELRSSGFTPSCTYEFGYQGKRYRPSAGKSWRTHQEGMKKLIQANRLVVLGSNPYFRQYYSDYPALQFENSWHDTAAGFTETKIYVVQTNPKIIERCVLMTTDPGDLVLDPTCGSGTTAFVAEQWGRRWITCDTSRVAITLAKQRLMTAQFDYYELAHPEEGVGSGFRYKTVPHVTLKSIANNPEIREGMTREQIDAAIAKYADQETLYDQPYIDRSRVRVTGPFTVEAVPAPTVRSLEDIQRDIHLGTGGVSPAGLEEKAEEAGGTPALPRERQTVSQQSLADFRHAATPPPLLDASVARKGPTLRHSEWRDELLKTGLRGKGGHHIDFSRVEPLAGTRWLHADAETKGAKPERVVFSFGPEFSLLDKIQVESAWEEARFLNPKPAILVFAAFEFDPDAAKDIDAMTKEKTGLTVLTAQMNADLLTEDLKKKRASNQGFWLVGRPDVEIRAAEPAGRGRYQEERPVDRKSVSSPGRAGETPALRGEKAGGISPASSSPLYVAEVRGFDYYDTRTGTIESGGTTKIAMWLLDTDYDGRSLYPRQVFFPMADDDEGWARLARNLKAEIDPELIEKYRGTVSLPFEAGPHKRVAVKVIDDRGVESLKVIDV
jgi:adenine-specific DNA-methyltransferase